MPLNRCGDVAGHFDVLHLVGPDRNEVAVVEQNVGRHQHRIRKEPRVGRQALGLFVLIGVALFQKVHRRDGHQQPRQLGELPARRIGEKRSPSSGRGPSQVGEGHLARVLLEELADRAPW